MTRSRLHPIVLVVVVELRSKRGVSVVFDDGFGFWGALVFWQFLGAFQTIFVIPIWDYARLSSGG